MVVTPQNIGEVIFSWKQQNALEKSTAAVKKDKKGNEILDATHTKEKYKEETSLSFMLAVWKTDDLIKSSAKM